MYVTRVPNRGVPAAVLLRESYRDGGKVKSRTLANLSRWPEDKVEALSRALKGLPPTRLDGTCRGQPVACRTGTLPPCSAPSRRAGAGGADQPAGSRQRDLVTAMITAAVTGGSSKLATARGLRARPRPARWARCSELRPCDEDDLYAAMDWLLPRQQADRGCASRPAPGGGTLVLYDVSSAAFEGRTCPLGEIGHARDGVAAGCRSSTGCSPAPGASRSR